MKWIMVAFVVGLIVGATGGFLVFGKHGEVVRRDTVVVNKTVERTAYVTKVDTVGQEIVRYVESMGADSLRRLVTELYKVRNFKTDTVRYVHDNDSAQVTLSAYGTYIPRYDSLRIAFVIHDFISPVRQSHQIPSVEQSHQTLWYGAACYMMLSRASEVGVQYVASMQSTEIGLSVGVDTDGRIVPRIGFRYRL